MFKSDDKVGNIELLEQEIKNIEGNSSKNKTGYWQKLSEICSKLSTDQLNYINNNENVISKKNKIMEAFNLFLFENFKKDFAEIPNCQKLCDDYIDTIQDTIANYNEQIANTIEENKELKTKIAELERKIKNNEKSNTKGTR